ncbi:MAG: hypothetical protein MH186_10185 [Marinobacter sp.]|nr:hypothetical protein [Marinobacter sp.]
MLTGLWINLSLDLSLNTNKIVFSSYLGKKSKDISFESSIQQFLGYSNGKESNITIIDLSGVPFEVLSITVSLIARLLF